MPRKSAAAAALTTVEPEPSRLRPPANLPAPERRIFASIVDACAPDHFRPSDAPLLVRYAEACALADLAASEIRRRGAVLPTGKMSPWIAVQEKATKAMIALSARLRLSPQARLPARTLSRQKLADRGRRPWEQTDAEQRERPNGRHRHQ